MSQSVLSFTNKLLLLCCTNFCLLIEFIPSRKQRAEVFSVIFPVTILLRKIFPHFIQVCISINNSQPLKLTLNLTPHPTPTVNHLAWLCFSYHYLKVYSAYVGVLIICLQHPHVSAKIARLCLCMSLTSDGAGPR